MRGNEVRGGRNERKASALDEIYGDDGFGSKAVCEKVLALRHGIVSQYILRKYILRDGGIRGGRKYE